MATYLCKTTGEKGIKGGRGVCETFIVVAADEAAAKTLVLDKAHPNATITLLVEVFDVLRVSIG